MVQTPLTPWQEHHFWIEILADHAIFVRDYLSPSEHNFVNEANQFAMAFDELRAQLTPLKRDEPASSDAMISFSRKAYQLARAYFNFEGTIQRLRIRNEININLSPSYFNGTLDENEEYLRQLTFYIEGKVPPPLSLLDLMDLWLTDQVGHASLLIDILDPIEVEFITKAQTIQNQFRVYISKNRAMRGFLRFTPSGFRAQQRFADEVAHSIQDLNALVEEVMSLFKIDEVLNNTTLRFLEHHFPESCYFLAHLSHYAPSIPAPSCSLTKPSYLPPKE
ncbi:DUF2935 domain-containing protein [Pseudalkalibacillus sp. JSM 102089]|uniref:DUF2935 domain-containing protein n=1 Tax=Pseudalkalibacillus sp. JSM 102089 TaxID=3229856 RepID=UPI003525AFEC